MHNETRWHRRRHKWKIEHVRAIGNKFFINRYFKKQVITSKDCPRTFQKEAEILMARKLEGKILRFVMGSIGFLNFNFGIGSSRIMIIDNPSQAKYETSNQNGQECK